MTLVELLVSMALASMLVLGLIRLELAQAAASDAVMRSWERDAAWRRVVQQVKRDLDSRVQVIAGDAQGEEGGGEAIEFYVQLDGGLGRVTYRIEEGNRASRGVAQLVREVAGLGDVPVRRRVLMTGVERIGIEWAGDPAGEWGGMDDLTAQTGGAKWARLELDGAGRGHTAVFRVPVAAETLCIE